MASTVADSCEVWNAEVRDPAGCVGAFGDCEHLRGLCGPGHRLEAGQLCWLTDRTPHESLPLPEATSRLAVFVARDLNFSARSAPSVCDSDSENYQDAPVGPELT